MKVRQKSPSGRIFGLTSKILACLPVAWTLWRKWKLDYYLLNQATSKRAFPRAAV